MASREIIVEKIYDEREIFYTYIYYDPSRGNEPFYVGKGVNRRAWKHLTRKDKLPFGNRLRKLKRNDIMPIIGIYGGLNEELSYLLEIELISKFGRKDLGKGTLLNLTDGGEGGPGIKRTPEQNKINSESKKGIPKSEEHKKNISKGKKEGREKNKQLNRTRKGH